MRNIFLPFMALLAIVMGSCSDDVEITANNEAAITGFTLGQIKRTMHTTDSKGQDSTYTINYAGSYFPMTIDQRNNTIYNRDSLPYGSQPKSILASIASIGSVAYSIAGEAEPEWKLYRTTDSIDFTYQLTFRVMSNDGKAYREYLMKLNIHQQEGEDFEWTKISSDAPFENMQHSKALFWKNSVVVLSQKNGELFFSQWNGNSWQQTPVQNCNNAQVRSVTALGDQLFVNTNEGKLLQSDNGINWTAVQTNTTVSHLITSSDTELFALNHDDIIASKDSGITWTKEMTDTPNEWLPTQEVNGLYYSLNNGNKQLILGGNRNPQQFTQDTTAVIWSRLLPKFTAEPHPWIYYPVTDENKFACPNLSHLTLIAYNNGIIALGGKPVGNKNIPAYHQLYISKDHGITWKQDEEIVMPQEVQGSNQCVTATVDQDQFIWLINGSSVWKGRLNELGFQVKD